MTLHKISFVVGSFASDFKYGYVDLNLIVGQIRYRSGNQHALQLSQSVISCWDSVKRIGLFEGIDA